MTWTDTDRRNTAMSIWEVATFNEESPERYLAYHLTLATQPGTRHQVNRGDPITTWMGLPNVLARVTWAGEPWRSNMGDTRQHFTCKANNGTIYHGVAYLTAGDYVRMRKAKR